MARFLFFSTPVEGHSASPLAIMRRLLETGHDVTWLAGRAYADRGRRVGVRHVPFTDTADWSGARPLDFAPGLRDQSGIALIRTVFRDHFVPQALNEVRDIEAAIDRYGADVLVTAGPNYGARMVGERLGIPVASIGDGPLALDEPGHPPFGPGLAHRGGAIGRLRNRAVRAGAARIFADAEAVLRDVRRQLGLPVEHPGLFAFDATDLHLQGSVAEIEYPIERVPDHIRFVGAFRPITPDDWSPPAWWPALRDDRPVVHVTQGTVRDDPRELLIPVIEALADQDVLVVATTGHADLSALKLPPDNVFVAPFVPYDVLLPHADLFVTNGGFIGTTMALHHGVPVLQIGNTEEKAEIGGRIAQRRLGASRKRTPARARLARLVAAVMTDADIARRVAAASTALRHHDAPVEAATHLVDLAAGASSRRKAAVLRAS